MKRLPAVAVIVLLSGCATITTSTNQSLFIDTPKVTGASCKLTDSKEGVWYLPSTPGSATVHKGNGPMNIVCEKEGYETTTVSVDETFQGATLGNILIGGGIGILIDAASGAAQKYPDKAIVWMKPLKWKSQQAQDDWLKAKREYDEKEAAKKKAAEEG